MNKPDWKDAPEWAGYLAMTENGEWVWFENEPFPSTNHHGEWVEIAGKSEFAGVYGLSWKDSAEPRP